MLASHLTSSVAISLFVGAGPPGLGPGGCLVLGITPRGLVAVQVLRSNAAVTPMRDELDAIVLRFPHPSANGGSLKAMT